MRERFAYKHISVSQLCQSYQISRQGYYKSIKRRRVEFYNEERLRFIILAQRKLLPREGGHKLYKRIRPILKREGIKIGRDKLFAFLAKEGLLIRPKKRYAKTTNSLHRFYAYNNLVKGLDPIKAHQIWVSDITYISTREGFMYLALITDAYSRKIVGFDISNSLELSGCLKALKMAIAQLPRQHQLIHHSDRGIQYCSKQYTSMLKLYGIRISMAAKGNCYENAMAERVNGILKNEFYLDEVFDSKTQAIKTANQSIDKYNKLRTHMSINYMTPSQKHEESYSQKIV